MDTKQTAKQAAIYARKISGYFRGWARRLSAIRIGYRIGLVFHPHSIRLSLARQFLFRSRVIGAYDYALASASLATQVVETIEWHINADEPRVHDYNLEFGRDPSLFDATTPYRSSDHDPVLVGLELVN